MEMQKYLASLIQDARGQLLLTSEQAEGISDWLSSHPKTSLMNLCGVSMPQMLSQLLSQAATGYHFRGSLDQSLISPSGPIGRGFFKPCGSPADVDVNLVAFTRQFLGSLKKYAGETNPVPSAEVLEREFDAFQGIDASLASASGLLQRHLAAGEPTPEVLLPRPCVGVGTRQERNALGSLPGALEVPCSFSVATSGNIWWKVWSYFRSRLGDDSTGPVRAGNTTRTGWDADTFAGVQTLARVIQGVARLTLSNFPPLFPEELVGRHGPGAVAEGRIDKFCFPTWSTRLESVFSYSEHGCYNYADWAENADRGSLPSDEVLPARFALVPKSVKTPWRTIAIEPTASQFCQQALWLWFREHGPKATYGSVNFRSQERNQQLALRASKDNSLATIDFSEASDRLSLDFVMWLFQSRPDIASAMLATRSEQIQLGKGGPCVRLRKYASMGNATTFPVESLAFYILGMGCSLFSQGKRVTPRNIKETAVDIAAFGDDLIVPTDAYNWVQFFSSWVGLVLNEDKSFRDGHFRESCGVDAWAGYDVTPTYIKNFQVKTAEDEASLLAAANGLFEKGWWHASEYVASGLRQTWPVVKVSAELEGLRAFSGSVEPPVKRWNPHFQREEHKVPRFCPKGLVRRTSGRSRLMRYLTSAENSPSPTGLGLFSVESAGEDRLAQPDRGRLHIRRKWTWLGQ